MREVDLPGANFAFDDGLISTLDDGQLPEQLFSEDVSPHPAGDEDLRRNLLRLLSQLPLGGRRMTDRNDIDAGWTEEAGEDVPHLSPLAQYSTPAAEPPPVPFPLTDPNNANALPVTCTYGTMKDGNLSFVSQDFRWFEASHFPDALNSQAEDSAGTMFLTITNWQPWFLANLKSAVPNFPVQSVLHLSDDSTTTMLPIMDRYLSEMSCVTEHIDMALDQDHETENGLNIGPMRTKSRPFAIWTAARYGLPHHVQRPLIIVATKSSENVVSKIAGHYIQVRNGQVSHVRWERLRANQTWVYLDLYNIFTKWDKVWGAVRSNFNDRIAEMQNRRGVASTALQARQAHFDNNVMITLHEHLRTHRASLQLVIRRTNEPSELQYWQASEILSARLDDALQVLEYYDQVASSLLEKQKNLLSLSSTLENMSHGKTISSLNSLALVFLPLSLVASIFGFNNITVSPKYFPAAALPALLLTIVIAYLANKLVLSDLRFPSRLSDTRPRDLEKLPTQRSVSTFNYPDVQGRQDPWYLPRTIIRNIFPTYPQPHVESQYSPPQPPYGTSPPAPSSYVPNLQGLPRSSFQSARPSSPPYRQGPDGRSAQSSGNSLPHLPPHLPTINPLWPPTTFPSFDGTHAPASTPTTASMSRTSLQPRTASPERPSTSQNSSPNVAIRKSSSQSLSQEVVQAPDQAVGVDIQPSSAAIEMIETAFPPPIPLRHPRSRPHVAFQLAEGSASNRELTPLARERDESAGSASGSASDSDGDVPPEKMIIARGMGDITDTEETGTERSSSSEVSEGQQADFSEIARRQAEAYGFDVGLATAPVLAPGVVATSEARSESPPVSGSEDIGGRGVAVMESFGDQEIVLEALRASGLSVNPGYVGRLVSVFESGAAVSPSSRSPRSPRSPAPEAQSPVIEPGMYTVEQEFRGLGIYRPEEYERTSPYDDGLLEDVDLYSAEEDKYQTPSREAKGKDKENQRAPPEPLIPIPPRHSSHMANLSTTDSAFSRPKSVIFRTGSPFIPSTPPIQVKKSPEDETENIESDSSNETAVTARTRLHSVSVASMYDADGFYESPTVRASKRIFIVDRDEHAEDSAGLAEEGVLEPLDEEQENIRISWVEEHRASWKRRQQDEADIPRTGVDDVPIPDAEAVQRTSSAVEHSNAFDEDEGYNDDGGGDDTVVSGERVASLLAKVALGPAGNRASVATGGSYTMGYLDTISEQSESDRN